MDELEQQIEELQNKLDETNKKLEEQSNNFDKFKKRHELHKHDGYDNTSLLDSNLLLKDGSFINIGNTYRANFNQWKDTVSEQNILILAVGNDGTAGFSKSTTNTQFEIINQPGTDGGTNQSFIQAFRSPVYANTGISVTSGTATITDGFFVWTTNELAGAYMALFDTDGTLKETQTIASNTASIITLDTAPSYTDADGSYTVFVPVYFCSAQHPFRRFYTSEGTGGGIRVGGGPTAGGQNGLLYMDATGDLYWRDKGGTAVKLN